MNDTQIFRKAAALLEGGQSVALVTVVAVAGSTPGKVGYKMLVCGETGRTVGTVGGGWVEAQMIEEAGRMLHGPSSRLFDFKLGETPDDPKGICGGSVELLVETFDSTALSLFQELADAIAKDGGGAIVSILSPDGLPRKLYVSDTKQLKIVDDPRMFVETLAPSPMLILCGAGHVAQHIAGYAASVHFRVTVCDDRSEYANPKRFPDADQIIIEDFERLLERIPIDNRSYIVIVTRGHQWDQEVLAHALKTDARYIGMIGSKQKTQTILESLRGKGVTDASLNRVYSPIGISIGAVTAEEIALSIVAEMVKIRRLGGEPPIDHMTLSAGKKKGV